MTSPLRPLVWAALVAGSFGLAGCSSIDDQGPLRWLTPYRMEVVQGNVVTSEMAAQLREGQTREQVRMLLGSPLLTDLFHADRWDYVFAIRRQGAPSQQRRLTVFFNADRVQRFQAADLPDELEKARALWSRKYSAAPTDQREWARQARFLQSRGFSCAVPDSSKGWRPGAAQLPAP